MNFIPDWHRFPYSIYSFPMPEIWHTFQNYRRNWTLHMKKLLHFRESIWKLHKKFRMNAGNTTQELNRQAEFTMHWKKNALPDAKLRKFMIGHRAYTLKILEKPGSMRMKHQKRGLPVHLMHLTELVHLWMPLKRFLQKGRRLYQIKWQIHKILKKNFNLISMQTPCIIKARFYHLKLQLLWTSWKSR